MDFPKHSSHIANLVAHEYIGAFNLCFSLFQMMECRENISTFMCSACEQRTCKASYRHSTKQVRRGIRRSPYPVEDKSASTYFQNGNSFVGLSMISCLTTVLYRNTVQHQCASSCLVVIPDQLWKSQNRICRRISLPGSATVVVPE